jgi:hypothetical protein
MKMENRINALREYAVEAIYDFNDAAARYARKLDNVKKENPELSLYYLEGSPEMTELHRDRLKVAVKSEEVTMAYAIITGQTFDDAAEYLHRLAKEDAD